MPRETLLDFFHDLSTARGEFLLYDDGYRRRGYSYVQVGAAAEGFAGRLHEAGLRKGDTVLFWGENRPEWVATFWGCLLSGAVAVPVDYRSSLEFARRIRAVVGARVVLVGEDVPAVAAEEAGGAGLFDGARVWPMVDLDWKDTRRAPHVPLTRDDTAEIIFTSGATADPKGVIITHRNVLANVVPIEQEVRRYRRWGRPFYPLRFLNLLPLSHMFGQAMATFIPPMLPGTAVFMRGHNPSEIVAQVKRRRISVVVCVPKILDVLREHVAHALPGAAAIPARPEHVAVRWWRYRQVHRAFGLKFWSFIVGAAPLDPALEEFWSRLGFLVIQGYGLTETAPIVSLNHPFAARRGSVGKAIPGVEIRIAADGEVLVRGENVTRGYFAAGAGDALEDGWLHTGDIGWLDEHRQLFVHGRKKEMIVTPEGLNIFPEDVEQVLNRQAGVIDSAVVGVQADGEERVHAVLVLDRGAKADAVVSAANGRLADHQRVRGVSVWEGAELPRTEGTGKLKRREIRAWVETGRRPPAARPGASSLEDLIARYAAGRPIQAGTTMEELGLTSLERVELMVALEETLQASVDETRFAAVRSVGELRALVVQASAAPAGTKPPAPPVRMPAWSRAWPARAFRRANVGTWVLPLAGLFARASVRGLECLGALEGPVVFAANHQSHFDTPVILSALPPRWRRRLSVAMAKEFFDAYFHPEGRPIRDRLTMAVAYHLAALFFNAFPLPQREAGARQSLRYIGDLVSEGWSVLIYPEGRISDTGRIDRFQAGVGMIGARLRVPVVPVRLDGVDRVLHRTWRMARRGAVTVTFGEPILLRGEDHAGLAQRVERAVKALGPGN
jgi:long-chain acyl-CoA synthetase